eukprot:g2064.t1
MERNVEEEEARRRERVKSKTCEEDDRSFSWNFVVRQRRDIRAVALVERNTSTPKGWVRDMLDVSRRLFIVLRRGDGEQKTIKDTTARAEREGGYDRNYEATAEADIARREIAAFLYDNASGVAEILARRLRRHLVSAGLVSGKGTRSSNSSSSRTSHISSRASDEEVVVECIRNILDIAKNIRRWTGIDRVDGASFYGSDIPGFDDRDESRREKKTSQGNLPIRPLSFYLVQRHDFSSPLASGGASKTNGHADKIGEKEEEEEEGKDRDWLVNICEQHLVLAGSAATMRAEDLATLVYETIKKTSSPEAMQTGLFEILGAQGIETMMTLMANADALRRSGHKRRKKKKTRRRLGGGNDDEVDDVHAVLERTEPRSSKPTTQRSLRDRLGLGPARASGAAGSSGGLPANAVRRVIPHPKRKGETLAEEIRIPAADKNKIRKRHPMEPDRPVSISELPEWAQLAFPGVKTLNRLQSALYQVAFKTSENMLVCAPTGAGKTNVAALAVLREISTHIDPETGVLDRSDFKIIYVAPMKALAQEVVTKFGKRLAPLGIEVKELTGDMQMTRKEIAETNMIVTTPEKWDVITRKSNADTSLIPKVRLLIIDEVHLLQDDRGAVIEVLVARTLRQVESAQKLVRLVGLSATLPNYEDVGIFMRVDLKKGLFYADDTFRPVPLAMQFVGVTEKNPLKQRGVMNGLAFEKARDAIRNGKQVLVFVHSRKDTVNTARALREAAGKAGDPHLFDCSQSCDEWSKLKQKADRSKDRNVSDLFNSGLGCHHAGMLRTDRSLTETLFARGAIKVLVCTATLAWGVNLPAHTVIIKGTKIYNPEVGKFVELSILDVKQIQGRAGRPQYDTTGEAIMITTHDKLMYYLRLMNHQLPIESSFIKALPDHLNAEIVSGTVTNMREAATWLSYTYLYIRMLKSPSAYGMRMTIRRDDPLLDERRRELCVMAAKTLDRCHMIRYDAKSGTLAGTALGRTASHYYIDHRTMETFKDTLRPHMSDEDVLKTVALSAEFEQLRLRDEEIRELEGLMARACPIKIGVGMGLDGSKAKANVLLQTYISGVRPRSFTLISDVNYVAQNAGRIVRALFEIALQKGWSALAAKLIRLSRSAERRIWWTRSPLRQFGGGRAVRKDVLAKAETMGLTAEKIRELSASEVGSIVRNKHSGAILKSLAEAIPRLDVEAKIQPITRTILRVTLTVSPAFRWIDRHHGQVLSWWIWVEDYQSDVIYHHEQLVMHKKTYEEGAQILAFTIPVFEPLPPQYYVRVMSTAWQGADTTHAVSFKHLILPGKRPPHTDLLDLRPLPISALKNPAYEELYRAYGYFNAVQTQIFHRVYHTDGNVLLGAPTGSGKTVAAELACFRLFEAHPKKKAVYVAPLKALVRERLADWRKKFGPMGRKVVELSGDVTPDARTLKSADIVITTPEKWDGVSRSWQKRGYVRDVGLVVIDEIHLLGADRGAVLEVIVARMRYIAAQRSSGLRIVGLSTALANAHDLAEWLGVDRSGLFNFRPSVRPVPIEVHISGFPGKHYCPRMATMNRPAFAAIKQHSPTKPVLVFVASRRQTRLTALDLIALAAADDNPRQFVRRDASALVEAAADRCKDSALKQCLAFGVGLHHAGLTMGDRKIVEEAFLDRRIQILVCTATLAWGVNLPAHCVILKGTEFYDGKLKRYVDFPITDVLQMIGRAGRPQFDKSAVACIFVHQPKKNFYRKFLYEPFPVESSLHDALTAHVNAEVASGTIKSREDAVDWLTWTYFFRRLLMNPTYYGLENASPEGVTEFLADVVDGCLSSLETDGCVELGEGGGERGGGGRGTILGRLGAARQDRVTPTTLGLIASYYYISSTTVGLFDDRADDLKSMRDVVRLISDASEYAELPVRHNEENLNEELAKFLPWKVDELTLDSPHTKTFLLLQSRMKRVQLPIADYVTDLRGVMDQAPRILNALVDVVANAGLLKQALFAMRASQYVMQARFEGDSPFMQLPGIDSARQARDLCSVGRGRRKASSTGIGIDSLADLVSLSRKDLDRVLERVGGGSGIKMLRQNRQRFIDAVRRIPVVDLRCTIDGLSEDGALVAGKEYSLTATIRLTHGTTSASILTRSAHKSKGVGWWLVLSDGDEELLALKRVFVGGSGGRSTATRASLSFVAPHDTGDLELYLVADAMIGVDRRVSVIGGGGQRPEETDEGEGFWVLPPASPECTRATKEGASEGGGDDEEGFWD